MHEEKLVKEDQFTKKYIRDCSQKDPRNKKHRIFREYVEDYNKDLNDYSIWTITRNTFDLVWSSWFLSSEIYGNLSFSEWIQWLWADKFNEGSRLNQSLYVEGVKNLNIITYENLVSDLRDKLDLHIVKKFNDNEYKGRKSHYSLDYSDDDLEKVKQIYKEDIERYSFEFDDRR